MILKVEQLLFGLGRREDTTVTYELWGTYILVGLAIPVYGICAALETALRTAQKSRLLQWQEDRVGGAALALQLREDPEQSIMTLQIGMTCCSITAAVLVGALAIGQGRAWLEALWPTSWLTIWVGRCILLVAAALLTYLTLVFGQFVPRALAQQHPERVVCWLARPLTALTELCHLLHAILAGSSVAVLWLLGQQRPPTFMPFTAITEEDVTTMVREGAERGIFETVEHELIAGVFEFTDTAAREVMVPRVHMQALEISTPQDEVVHRLFAMGYSRIPVYDGDLDHILGILHAKDVFRALGEERSWDVRSLIHPPLYVPEMVQISRLLRMLQQRRLNMAIVVDEHGGVAGLITTENLLEQLVGDIHDEDETEGDALVTALPDGALIVQGSAPLWELREHYALPLQESTHYHTLAGLLLTRLGHIPQGGETIIEEGYTCTVVDMDGPRIARVKIERRATEAPAATSDNQTTSEGPHPSQTLTLSHSQPAAPEPPH